MYLELLYLDRGQRRREGGGGGIFLPLSFGGAVYKGVYLGQLGSEGAGEAEGVRHRGATAGVQGSVQRRLWTSE